MDYILSFFSPEFHGLVRAERNSFLSHAVSRDPAVFNSFVKLIPEIKAQKQVLICCKENQMGGTPYRHYFLQIGSLRFEFGGGELQNAQVVISAKSADAGVLVKYQHPVLDWDPLISRMAEVIGMTTYSVCLRNCEHIANFVVTGYWISSQVNNNINTNLFWKVYSKVQNIQINHLLGQIPANLELHADEAKSLQLVGVSYTPSVTSFQPQVKSDVVENRQWDLAYRAQDSTGQDIDESTYIVLLLGPTGAGKSRLINLLFNQIDGTGVAEAKMSASSVSKQLKFYYGLLTGFGAAQKVCLIDTIGLCDTVITSEEVVKLIENRIEGLRHKLNHIVFLFHGRLEKPQSEAIESVLQWIQLEATNCSFFVTKTDFLEEQQKEEYAASWGDSPLVQGLREARYGFDENKQVTAVNNFGITPIPNPTENSILVKALMRQLALDSRNNILKCIFPANNGTLSFSKIALTKDSLGFFQKYLGCSLL